LLSQHNKKGDELHLVDGRRLAGSVDVGADRRTCRAFAEPAPPASGPLYAVKPNVEAAGVLIGAEQTFWC